jgi:hypothetical protein
MTYVWELTLFALCVGLHLLNEFLSLSLEERGADPILVRKYFPI